MAKGDLKNYFLASVGADKHGKKEEKKEKKGKSKMKALKKMCK